MGINMRKKQKVSQVIGMFGASAAMFALSLTAVELSPMADMVKEFGIPMATATAIIDALDAADGAATIISILAGLATGGLGLIAAAGKTGVKKFLKKQIKKKGKKAVIAW